MGADNLLWDDDDREFYSTDIYSQHAIAELVIRPGTAQEVAAAVKLCSDHARAVIARGGARCSSNAAACWGPAA